MARFFIVSIALVFNALLHAQDLELQCKDPAHIATMEAAWQQNILEFQSNPYTLNYDLKYHRLEWQVDPAVQYISGQVTSYFAALEDDFQDINFELAANMRVTNVYYHGQEASFVHHSDDRLQIMLPQPLTSGTLDSVSVSYYGEPVSGGFGTFVSSAHAGTPVLWTLSEPYGAKQWWPCKQSLNDKIDSVDIIVATPFQYRAASNGVLLNEYQGDATNWYHWRHRYPIPAYLIAIGVTNYSVFSDQMEMPNGDTLEILNYVYPESLAQAENQLENTIEIMELFNELFGPYPFAAEKYGHAQFGFGGGMEHQTMSFMGGFSYSLQAHELAHQWFGDKVTCGSWEHIWLNEGFATYLTGLTSEFRGTAQAWYNWKQGRINNITSAPDGSVWVNDTTSVNRIFSGRLTYDKGAMLLHMLRWKLGDEAFFSGVREYVQAPGIAYDYALTADLQAHLEAASGQELDEFFNDWFYGQGYPSYTVEWSERADGLPGVALRISQTSSHASVAFFDMPLPVKVFGEGQDSLLRLDHSSNGQTWAIELPFQVDSVAFDPDLWLISRQNTVIQQPVITGLEDDLASLRIRVFPNPAHDLLHIQWDAEAALSVVNANLFNSQGQQVSQLPVAPGQTTLSLSLRQLPAGAYTLQLQDASGQVRYQQQVLKVR